MSIRFRNVRGDLWVRYHGLALSLAMRFSRTHGKPLRELVDEVEGALAVLLCGDWKRFEGSSTWMYTKLYWHLMEYCRRETKRAMESLDVSAVEEEPPAILAVTPGWLEVMWSELGQEGRMLLRVVFEAPGALAEELWTTRRRCGIKRAVLRRKGPEQMKKAVLLHLQRERWPEEQIRMAWKQVQEVCS